VSEYQRILANDLQALLESNNRGGRIFAPANRLENYINDFELYSPEEQEQAEEQGEAVVGRQTQEQFIYHDILPADVVPVVAVDSSVAFLGESDVGCFAAFKCAVVYTNGYPSEVFRYCAHLTEASREVYGELRRLISNSFSVVHPPTCSLDRLPYRIMNLIERLTQLYACTQIRNGIVLWDGALTRTKETGKDFFEHAINLARNNGNTVVAISKKTRLRLTSGEKLSTILENRRGAFAVDVHHLLPDRILGDLIGRVYVVKFTDEGFSFRIDIAPPEADCLLTLNRVKSSVDFTYGYPEPLAKAHALAYFTSNEIIALQAYIMERYSLRLTESFDIRIHVLGPFGGGWKYEHA
jgi:hypothetical protein